MTSQTALPVPPDFKFDWECSSVSTPLFAIAAAVVTDHGGVLSPREYAIPAVVGTKLATSLVRDGQTITVDGQAGTVTLEAD